MDGGIGYTYFTRSHHHTTTDSIKRVRADTSTSSDSPAKSERSQEVTLKSTNEEDRLDRIVHAEVETTIHNNTGNGGTETAIEATNTIGGECLLVHVDKTIELTIAAGLSVLCIVGKTGTGVIERVHEEERSCTGGLFGRQQLEIFNEQGTYTAGS